MGSKMTTTKTLTCRSCGDDFEHGGTRQKRRCPKCYAEKRRETWRESKERGRRAAGMVDMYTRRKREKAEAAKRDRPSKPQPRKLIPYAGYDRTEMRR